MRISGSNSIRLLSLAETSKSDNELENEHIAEKIKEIYQLHPDMGYRRIRDELDVNYGIPVNDKRVFRIYQKIGVQSSIKWRPKVA